MAKHTHRIMLMKKKTWRCTLDGCSWFIHAGLAERVLQGKIIKCWECGEDFRCDERALTDDQPICDMCRDKKEGGVPLDDLENYIQTKFALTKAGVQSVDELTPTQKNTMIAMGALPKPDTRVHETTSIHGTTHHLKDQIEVIEPDEEN